MKKTVILWMVCVMLFGLSACSVHPSQNGDSPNTDGGSTQSETEGNMEHHETFASSQSENHETNKQSGILIAYFSHTGNTEVIAGMIAEYTGGELFQVETTTVYPDEYNDLIEQAHQEQNDDARPELASSVEDMDAYDTIFIGYPNWWGTMPMTMFTFLESYDFSGKTVVPFCTHEGSALGSSERDISELILDAGLLEGLAVRGQTAQNRQDEAREAVTDWLREGGFIE